METTAVFRDPSAWYHIVIAVDTTQATDTNRVKIYINGAQVTSFITATYPPTQNMDIGFYNTTTPQQIGTLLNGSYGYFDGYISQVHFIDGQALTPTSFGRVSTQTGVWVPKNYAGTYGTNGYKLDFSNANMLGGDNQSSSGDPYWNNVVLSLNMNGTNGSTTFTDSKSGLVPTVYGNTQISSSTSPFAGGSSGYFDGSGDYLSYASSSTWDLSGDFCIECWVKSDVSFTSLKYIFNRANGTTDANAYCLFVNNSTPGRVTFAMNANEGGQYALESTTNLIAGTWYHIAVTRSGSTMRLFINGSQEDTFTSTTNLNVAVPFIIGGNYNWQGNIDDFRITKGAARYTYNFTPPTSENPSTGGGGFGLYGGIGSENQVIDTPTNNFATLNPLNSFSGHTLGNAGLKVSSQAATQGYTMRSTIALNAGKWYWETQVVSWNTNGIVPGIIRESSIKEANCLPGSTDATIHGGNSIILQNNINYVNKDGSATSISFGHSVVDGDYLCMAIDFDNNKIWYRFNNEVWLSGGDPTAGTSPTQTITSGASYYPAVGSSTSAVYLVNFGQGGQSGLTYNSASGGRFKYTPPTGFKALCSSNLPDPTIKNPSLYFNAAIWAADGTARNYALGNFTPDMVWTKCRNTAENHRIIDTIRGKGTTFYKTIKPDLTSIEGEDIDVTNISASGLTVSANGNTPSINGRTYVAWSWKKGTTPGFDIVTYQRTAGTDGVETINHNLGKAPSAIFIKGRDNSATNWHIWWPSFGQANYLNFNTNSLGSFATQWGTTAHTSTQFQFYSWASTSVVAYLFAEIAGFSKFGSYTGNGSSTGDGPFIWCGFQPRWIMIKRTDSSGPWIIYDTARDTFNRSYRDITANTSDDENNVTANISGSVDILSNGFKIRSSSSDTNYAYDNASGGTYIFAAFAEAPFKYARAR